MTSHAPVAAARLVAPDLARGLMLALIAIANVAPFVLGTYGPRQHVVEEGWLDRLVGALVVALVDGRAYPLFALLYGYGVVRLVTRPDAGRRVVRRRCAVLIGLGALHAVLLFPGDILGLYGVLGLVLLAVMRLTDRAILMVAASWLVPACLVQGLVYSSPGGSAQRSHFWSFTLDDAAAVLPLRALEWLMTPFGLLPVVSAALVGVLAARHRVPERVVEYGRLLRWTAALLLPLAVLGGLPSGLVVAGVVGTPSPAALAGLAVVHSVTGVAGGIGLAALLTLVAGRAGTWSAPLVALGKRSLSGYLFLSLTFVLVLTPVGFGLGGLGLGATWRTAATTGLALLTWLVAVAGGMLLERAGRPGPAEALVRRFVRSVR